MTLRIYDGTYSHRQDAAEPAELGTSQVVVLDEIIQGSGRELDLVHCRQCSCEDAERNEPRVELLLDPLLHLGRHGRIVGMGSDELRGLVHLQRRIVEFADLDGRVDDVRGTTNLSLFGLFVGHFD